MRFDLASAWLMTPDQARRLGDLAERHGLSPEALVVVALDRIADRIDYHYLFQKVMWRMSWLLKGFPLELAPYYRIHRRYGVDPLQGHMRPGQIDMSIEDFIELAVVVL
jgi:hypothetical protein